MFFLMCGEAAKLAVSVLCKGNLVKSITIYGIVVAVHNHREAQLLKLKINNYESACIFERCRKRVPFQVLINEIVNIEMLNCFRIIIVLCVILCILCC